jgi:hypothetical protein
VSRGMQEEWAAGVSRWAARREVERVNLYFRRKMGILKGHSTDEWNEGYGEWQDRALMSQASKWLRRPGKPVSRSQAKRHIVACVRESADRSASRRRRISSPRQAARKTEAREAKPERQPEASADHLVTEDSDEEEILSTEPVAATYDGIYVFSQKAEKRHGPYTMIQLQKLVDQGYFSSHDLAIYQGLEQWVTLEHVPNIRFPVVEAPAEPEAEPAAEEILAPEEDAPALTTELVEDAESDQQQAEAPGKRNLAGFLFRVVAPTFATLLLLLWLCDILNQHMGWSIPIGLGVVGISTTDDAKEGVLNDADKVGDQNRLAIQKTANVTVSAVLHSFDEINPKWASLPPDGSLHIIMHVDGSGSILSVRKALGVMKDTILKERLLSYYRNDELLYQNRVSIVDGEGERTLKFFAQAAKKENVLALVFQDEAAPAYHVPSFNKKPTDNYLVDLKSLQKNLEESDGYYRGIMFQVDRGKTFAKSFVEFVQSAWRGEGYLSGQNLKPYYWTLNNEAIQNHRGIVFSDEYHAKSEGTPAYYMELIFNAARKIGLDFTEIAD